MASNSATYRARFCDWLVAEGSRQASIPDYLDGFCRFLNGEGFAIYRANLATEAVHPLIANTRHVWHAEAGDPGLINPAVVISRRQFAMGEAMVDEVLFNAGSQRNPQYLASPFFAVESLGALYEPVHRPGRKQKYPLFDDLAVLGCTGYYACLLDSHAGLLQKFGLATRRPRGLSPAMVVDLGWSIGLFTLHLDTLIEDATKSVLARSYLGVGPGDQVCAGMISRGGIVTLEAAVWMSDMRGFTALAEAVGGDALIAGLNDYFDAVVPAIYGHGGEVLKFIGDAILAIFPYGSAGPQAACAAAIAAVGEADRELEKRNRGRRDLGQPALEHGIGLACGEVSYGNIGSRERLDFTVIGPTVNLAARIESLTRTLARPVLCTTNFAEAAGVAAETMGAFEMKGFARPVPIAAPAADLRASHDVG